jgi:spectinomycin phosphotransferase
MLEKPDIQEQLILSRLGEEFGLHGAILTFLPIGADFNTAVYRVTGRDDTPYFLKLRKGDFSEITLTVPLFLKQQGIREIIAPLETHSGGLWAELDEYRMMLYPFIEGKDGYEQALTERQWLDFGAALGRIHAAPVPSSLARRIPRENFSTQWRDMVKDLQAQVEREKFTEPTSAKLAAYMREKKSEIDKLIDHTQLLAGILTEKQPEPVLCHSDLHAGNLLITSDGAFYIVDWDAPLFAPRERDLAMVGGSYAWNDPRGEALFYQGYGPAQVDKVALEYFRLERIVMDLAAYGEQLLLSDEGSEDREQGLLNYVSNFLPGREIELAYRTNDY